MRICIIYFSGTGNTKLISMSMRDCFVRIGHYAEIRSVENDDFANDLDDFDLIGFGFPVYAWRAPAFYAQKLKEKLPMLNEKPAFVFNTRAIASWWSNYYVALLLQDKGMVIMDAASFTTPPNDWMVLFREKNLLVRKHVKFDKHIFESVQFFAERVEKRALTGFRFLSLGKNILGLFVSNFGNFLGKILFGLIAKMWKVDKKQCTSCGFCAKNCPSGNIKMIEKNGRLLPQWNSKCVYCFRCVNYCPEDAVLLSRMSKNKYRYRLKTGFR